MTSLAVSATPRPIGRLARLLWYRDRLAAMSVPEILHRVREQQRRLVSRYHVPQFAALLRPGERDLPALPGLAEGIGALARDGSVLTGWQQLAAQVRDGRFHFLGVDWPAAPAPDWHLDPVTGKRWPAGLYCFDIPYRHAEDIGDVKYVWELSRLQYLQPLAAYALLSEDSELAALCARHIESWIDQNPPFRGVHWASGIELAQRVVSLLVVTSLIGASAFSPALVAKLRECLAGHGWWIQRYPSRFSSANNHAITEAAALFLLGTLMPGLKSARAWAAQGSSMLEREARLQFHRDGVGAEQSPAYAAFSLEWLLLCAHVGTATGRPFSAGFLRRLRQAGWFLRQITDHAGNQPLIGDDDDGRTLASGFVEPDFINSVLGCLAAETGEAGLAPPVVVPHLRHAVFGQPAPAPQPAPAVLHYPTGGYTVARSVEFDQEAMWVMDHGPLGYLSIAAHGHADALSVWFHLGGQPILVDAGTYLYHSGGAWRDHFRSTAAHNTLTLNGANSSHPAGAFNWGERAAVSVTEIDQDPLAWIIEAEHDGYAAVSGYRHSRRLERRSAGQFIITDRLLGSGGVERVEIGFLLHPSLTIVASSSGWVISLGGRQLLDIRHVGGLKGWVESGLEEPKRGWYSPRFGGKEPAPRLVFAGKMWHEAPAQFIFTLRS